MHTKFLPHPGHIGSGVMSSLGFALLRLPVRSVPSAPAPVVGRHTVRDAARQLSGKRPPAPPFPCDINQVLGRMVRIARTLVPAGVRIAERYTAVEQPGVELPEFHQVVLHLILDAAQALRGCGTIDVASRCVDGEVCISISDTRASPAPGWGLMGAGGSRHAECTSLGLLMAKDFTEEHGGRVSSTRLASGGNVVTIVFALQSRAIS